MALISCKTTSTVTRSKPGGSVGSEEPPLVKKIHFLVKRSTFPFKRSAFSVKKGPLL